MGTQVRDVRSSESGRKHQDQEALEMESTETVTAKTLRAGGAEGRCNC